MFLFEGVNAWYRGQISFEATYLKKINFLLSKLLHSTVINPLTLEL